MTTRERSTAYPSLSLREAVELVDRVRNGLGSGEVTREQIAPVIGHENLSGPAASKVAAIAHYGLLDKGKGTYRVSELATKILSPIGDAERVEALQMAALQPSLFRSVYEKYSPDGRLPEAIEAIMHRDYGVTREAAKTAHENLVESLVYAGLLDAETRAFANASSEDALGQDEGSQGSADSGSGSKQQSERVVVPPGSQVYELPMSLGTARIVLPPKLTLQDFQALESLVGLVKHFVSSSPAGDGSAAAQKDE